MRQIIFLGIPLLYFASRSASHETGSTSSTPTLRIGYTNIERVRRLMPEARAADSLLRAYRDSLMIPLQQKQAAFEKKYQEFMELQQKGLLAPIDAEKRQQELYKLNEDIQRLRMEAAQKIQARGEELFQPIQDKLRKAIDDLAQKEGYDYIFNNSNATGEAFLLHASKEHDVTKRLLQQLGIPVDSLPEEEPQ